MATPPARRTSLRSLWFQMHWLLGISAGIVLAVMGVTGAMLSFEHELLRALNPGIMTVAPRVDPVLTPPQLIERIAAAHPQRPIGTISVSAIPGRSARVGFLAAGGAAQPPARARMDVHFVDPYTGTLLGREEDLRAHALLHAAEDLHRRLAAGDVGKAITGASTLVLLVLAGSGLYLRWPRRWRDWRAWLVVRWRIRGSPFLKSLHEVAATWLLVPCLVIAMTGLWWSYDWYRNGLLYLAGTAPQPRQPMRAGDDEPASVADVNRAWSTFLRETANTNYSSVSLNIPGVGQPLVLTYLDARPEHERAANRLVVDAGSGAALSHERYDTKGLGERLTSSVFALHKGSYFGVGGTVIAMVCSLGMPLFAVTGWLLYLKRRKARAGSALWDLRVGG